MRKNTIYIKGAKENNLKNIDLEIPRDELIVFTGVSGSGKSSLAFDTIYAEGQRRYVESLSSYARQFLGQMDKPEVEQIDGLSPAISIDQKTTSNNPRSTVGTVTEIYDYLRLLYARVGIPHCPICGAVIKRQSVDQIVNRIMELPIGTKVQVLAPIIRAKKGEHIKELTGASRSGFVRARVDGSIYDLSEEIFLDKNKKHTIEIIVDRLMINEEAEGRLSGSVETAAALSKGLVTVLYDDDQEMSFSQNYACPEHDIDLEELTPRAFSFNNPYGACSKCSGLGILMKIDPAKVVPAPLLSIKEGAIRAGGWNYDSGGICQMYFEGLASHYGFSLDAPYHTLSEKAKEVLMYGTKGEKIQLRYNGAGAHTSYMHDFEGIINNLNRRYSETTSDYSKKEIESMMSSEDCPECRGDRLKPEILAVTVGDKNISDLCKLPITDMIAFFDHIKFSKTELLIAERIIKEIETRLGFLRDVGLEYLTLARSASTLSGGEGQRIRLATQVGSGLTGVLYILDEPSIGLHQRDNAKLLATLKGLRDLGNTLIVVEHDEETMREADTIVDIGPGAGIHGGEVLYVGPPEGLKDCKNSITSDYLFGRKAIEVPYRRRKPTGALKIFGAAENNLKNIDVTIPLGVITCVTGVSGSGKSSLVNDILFAYLSRELNGSNERPGKFERIEGIEQLDKVIDIDQSPIGRTPRSNPATYTGLFTDIRDLFTQTQDARAHGFGPGRFSFNVRGGRCEACQGDGIIKIEMHFLPDVYVPCEVCGGRRYNKETLEVKFKGKNIYEVLEMTVDEGVEFFSSIPKIHKKLSVLQEVGLGYIKLGQPATTLSGGEAQRVKLSAELARRSTGKTVYLLDEPTTGLHTADVHKLVEVLQKLVAGGNTIIVIEHNLDVIKIADHLIDLGPEGGDKGGEIVVCGTPEQVIKCEKSYTGQYLKRVLKK
ncbi:MAG TPA: excinuclease ABC subunit UvrA [Oscillospiraceae bacterium]|nr:excinuclease ABC subunit UvrA [Oscillospiraceae bacterium]